MKENIYLRDNIISSYNSKIKKNDLSFLSFYALSDCLCLSIHVFHFNCLDFHAMSIFRSSWDEKIHVSPTVFSLPSTFLPFQTKEN